MVEIGKHRKNISNGIYRKLLIVLLSINYIFIYSQNVGINGTGGAPNSSAMLDIDASPVGNKGVLIPRIALLATNLSNPVISPATSLLIYNTATASSGSTSVIPGFYYWDGLKWVRLQVASNASLDWSIIGNTGTNSSTNFIGTTDLQDLVFKTNNTEKARFTVGGNVGIGTPSPGNKLEVFGGWNNNIVDNTFSGYSSYVYSSLSSTHASHFIGSRGRGTFASPSHPLNGDALACFQGRNALNGIGYGGINIDAAENHSASSLGSKIRFYTVQNGTTSSIDRMVIEENGKVAIGTNNPFGQFEVSLNSNNSGDAITRFFRTGAGSTGFIDFHSGAAIGDWNPLTSQGDKSLIFSNDLDPMIDAPSGLLIAPWVSISQPGGGLKGVKIMENGNVGIGISNPIFALHINGTTACSGNVWTSDLRKKQDINPLEINAIEIIKKLNPVTYEWKEIKDIGMKGLQMGFIAQELEMILPSMVITSNDDEKSKGVKYIELLAVYAKAIQELQQEIELTKKEIELLKKIAE